MNANHLNQHSNTSEIIRAFSGLKAMVVGDVMTDSYIFGKVDRISPEAPVPVVHISRREARPGGAANVAINLKSLGATPLLCSVTGDDEAGNQFIALLEEEGLSSQGVLRVKGRKTTVKSRVIGNNHQLLRVDDECVEELEGNGANSFISHCCRIIETEKPDVLIFEDYDKGVLSEEVIRRITDASNHAGIPVAVDPKKKHFNTYADVALFKPNLHELKSGLGITIEHPDVKNLREAITPLFNKRNMQTVMVTLSEAGVFIASRDEAHLLPAHVRNISDVSGAGDTVISVAALCLALKLPVKVIAGLSNLAGGLVCERVGVVPIDKKTLMEEAEKNHILQESETR